MKSLILISLPSQPPNFNITGVTNVLVIPCTLYSGKPIFTGRCILEEVLQKVAETRIYVVKP